MKRNHFEIFLILVFIFLTNCTVCDKRRFLTIIQEYLRGGRSTDKNEKLKNQLTFLNLKFLITEVLNFVDSLKVL